MLTAALMKYIGLRACYNLIHAKKEVQDSTQEDRRVLQTLECYRILRVWFRAAR